MAIDTTDQTAPLTGEDGGASISVDDADLIPEIDEEPVQAGPQQGQQRQLGQKQPGQRASRKERRGAFDNVSKQLEEKLMGSVKNELSSFKSEFSRMLDGMRQQSAPQQQQQPQRQQVPDPFQQRLALLDSARDAEMKAMQNHDRSKGPYDFTNYRKLENDRAALIARAQTAQMLQEMGLTPEMVQQMRQPQQPRQAFGEEAQKTARFYRIQEEFPGIKENAHWKQVGAYRNYLLNTGRPDTLETDMEAAAHVVAQLGLGRRIPRANPGLYAAPGGGERGGDSRQQQREVRLPAAAVNALSDKERAMASRFIFEGGDA